MPTRLLWLPAVFSLSLAACVQQPPGPNLEAGAPTVLADAQAAPAPLAPTYPSWDDVNARLAQQQPVLNPPPSLETSARATIQTVSTPAPQGGVPLSSGASFHATTASLPGLAVALEVVLFDDRQFALKVIDQPQDYAGGGKITECMRQAGAVAGVNGGFFTPEFTPMGVMVADGKTTGAWQSNKLLTGAVVTGGGRARLVWNAEARGWQREATQFLQAGPRLVDAGQAVPGLERAKNTTRTFIATDGGHRWIFGLARRTSLGDLAEVLAKVEVVPGFRVERALNLDGGRSSALYYRTADGREHSDPGWSTVRNYVAIVPK